MTAATLYDGQSAQRRRVTLSAAPDALLIDGEPVPTASLVARDPAGGPPSYGRREHPGWRLILDAPPPPDIAARLPAFHRYGGGVIDRVGLWPATLAFAALAAIAIVVVLNTPSLVARLVPASVERRLGEAIAGDFGRNGCSTPAGDVALARLVARVDPRAKGIEVHVVKVPMVNAVTLPGGRIVIFDGLLQGARSPDEVAGVIGHEIGHVRGRDTMEALLRQLGLSVLLGGFGGNASGTINVLLASSYSREAEARADAWSLTLLEGAHVSPAPTAAFFRRLGGRPERAERMLSYIASHPVSADRANRFAAARVANPTPALDAPDWRALRAICAKTKTEWRWRF